MKKKKDLKVVSGGDTSIVSFLCGFLLGFSISEFERER